jgi:WD40 repeat protein
MHIYHSALPWSPTSSLTRQLYQRQLINEVKLVNTNDAHWDACIRTIPIARFSTGITFSHNGSELAVCSEEYTKIFETATGVSTFEVGESAVSIAFSPDDDMLACGSKDGTVRIWDIQTSVLVQSFAGHGGRIFSVVFSPCGNMIVSGSDDNTIRIWDISIGCKCALTGHTESVSAVCWSGTGDRVISGSWDASVRVWDVSRQTCLMVLRGHTREVTAVAFSLDSALVASGSLNGTVRVYDARSGHVLQRISTDRMIDSVQFSTQDNELLFTNWNSATAWDLSSKMQATRMFHSDGFRAAFSPDGTRVASDGCGFVKIWKTKNKDFNSEAVNNHFANVDAIAFAPDGRVMASWSRFGFKIWDTASGECLFTFDCHFPRSIVFSPDFAFFACWYDFSYISVWNSHTLSRVNDVDLEFTASFLNIALSPCGGRLVSQEHSQIILWDLGSGKRLAHSNYNSLLWKQRLAFSADGTSVLTPSDDSVQRWIISPAPVSDHPDYSFPNTNQFDSLPLVFIPAQEESSHQVVSVPRQYCYYQGDEWVLDENEKRILWLPSDRRGEASASEYHSKKIAIVGANKRVSLADFSDALLPSL